MCRSLIIKYKKGNKDCIGKVEQTVTSHMQANSVYGTPVRVSFLRSSLHPGQLPWKCVFFSSSGTSGPSSPPSPSLPISPGRR